MKKKNSYLILMIALVCSICAEAQNFSIGAKGGISIPNLISGGDNNNPLNTGYSSRLGPDAGVFAEFRFSDLFSLEPMLECSSQGGKKNGIQALTTPAALAATYPSGSAPEYLYAGFNNESRLNYFMIPVLAKFGWNFGKSNWRIYVDGGPFVGFLLSAKQVTNGSSQLFVDPKGQEPLPGGVQSFDNTEDIKSELNTVNFGIEGNIGLIYSFGASSIFMEGGCNYGFLNIQKNSENGKNEAGAGTALAGYSYRFHKRVPESK